MAVSTKTLDDARLLLDFVSRKGIQLNGDEVRAVVELEAGSAAGGNIATDTIVKFWDAFAKLCRSAKPATVGMIRATTSTPNDLGWWHDRRGLFPVAGVILFASVAAAQVYVGVGARLVNKLSDERVSYQQKADNTARVIETESALSGVAGKATGDQRKAIEEQLTRARQQAQELSTQIARQATRIGLYLDRLERWNRAWQIVVNWPRERLAQVASWIVVPAVPEANADDRRSDTPGGGAQKQGDAASPPRNSETAASSPLPPPAPKVGVGVPADGNGAAPQERPEQAGPDLLAQEEQQAAALLDASTVLDAFQSLILPFLYGALGSCVLLLKRHSEEIADGISSPKYTFRVRLALGCMAGVAIGWVATLVVSDDARTLAPQTLAFLAGYNVEMLAAALDKISFR